MNIRASKPKYEKLSKKIEQFCRDAKYIITQDELTILTKLIVHYVSQLEMYEQAKAYKPIEKHFLTLRKLSEHMAVIRRKLKNLDQHQELLGFDLIGEIKGIEMIEFSIYKKLPEHLTALPEKVSLLEVKDPKKTALQNFNAIVREIRKNQNQKIKSPQSYFRLLVIKPASLLLPRKRNKWLLLALLYLEFVDPFEKKRKGVNSSVSKLLLAKDVAEDLKKNFIKTSKPKQGLKSKRPLKK